MTVDKQIVMDEWDLPFGGNPDEDVEILEDTISNTSRWSIHHRLIVRIKDKFYATSYSLGATESQDERPWDHSQFVVFSEVKQVDKIVKVWEPVG